MQHEEFEAGLVFVCSGRRWRCTDIGRRTVVAFALDHDDDSTWYRGPPYAVAETVLDEYDQAACSLEDERVDDVRFDEANLIVDLMDGRTISVPLARYPLLFHAGTEQRTKWKRAWAGYSIYWPAIDEDISIEGLLHGVLTPKGA